MKFAEANKLHRKSGYGAPSGLSRSRIRSSRRPKRSWPTPPGTSTLFGIWFGLATTNGAWAMPRKPEPMVPKRLPTLTKWGRSNSRGPISLADDGAEAGIADAAGGDVAGVHLVGGPLMLAFAVGHGADEGDVAHLSGDVGPALGDADAVDRGGDRLRRTAGAWPPAWDRRSRTGSARRACNRRMQAMPWRAQLFGVQGHRVLPAKDAQAPAPAPTLRRNVRRLSTPSRLV